MLKCCTEVDSLIVFKYKSIKEKRISFFVNTSEIVYYVEMHGCLIALYCNMEKCLKCYIDI